MHAADAPALLHQKPCPESRPRLLQLTSGAKLTPHACRSIVASRSLGGLLIPRMAVPAAIRSYVLLGMDSPSCPSARVTIPIWAPARTWGNSEAGCLCRRRRLGTLPASIASSTMERFAPLPDNQEMNLFCFAQYLSHLDNGLDGMSSPQVPRIDDHQSILQPLCLDKDVILPFQSDGSGPYRPNWESRRLPNRDPQTFLVVQQPSAPQW